MTTARPARPKRVRQHEELLALYRQLGGILEEPVLRPGSWDVVLAGPLVIELDEELHFNRYRALTLTASWAQDLPWSQPYRQFCTEYEDECLAAGAWGKRWTNASSARMFAGGPAGDLESDGAPRWKQRALYDVMKDATPGELGVRMARLSIYDQVADRTLGDVLDGRARSSTAKIRALLTSRASS